MSRAAGVVVAVVVANGADSLERTDNCCCRCCHFFECLEWRDLLLATSGIADYQLYEGESFKMAQSANIT